MTIKAKYPGRCKSCGNSITVGQEIEWTKNNGARHLDCTTQTASVSVSNGNKVVTVKDFEYAAEPGHVFKEGNKWLTVISSHGWWCDEPLSFGKMDGDDGYIYDWKCREATPEEIATADSAQKAAKAKEDTERAARAAKNQAEKAEYEQKREALVALRDQLIADNGLVKVESVPSVEGSKHEDLGSITPPGKGFSWTWFLRGVRDAQGNLLYVCWSNEEAGATYWGTEEIKRAGQSVQRVSQWWLEEGYGAESYPGPGVPRKELSKEEIVEVERLETAKYEECVRRQSRSWQGWINSNTSNGTVTPNGVKLFVSVPKAAIESAQKEKAHLESLSGSGWSDTYADPNRREYLRLRPLEVEISECTPAASFYEDHSGGGNYAINITFPVKPEPAVLKELRAAGLKPYQGFFASVRKNTNLTYSATAVDEYRKINRAEELKTKAQEIVDNYNL